MKLFVYHLSALKNTGTFSQLLLIGLQQTISFAVDKSVNCFLD